VKEKGRRRRRLGLLALSTASAVCLQLTHQALGATETWTTGSSNWDTATNWDNGAGPVPGSGDTADILNDDNTSRTITYNYAGSPITLGTLIVDNEGGGQDTLSMTGSGLTLAVGEETVGGPNVANPVLPGWGALTQSGGTNTASDITIGYGTNNSGFYTLSGAGLLSVTNTSFAELIAQDEATATFNQTGGTNTTPGGLIVGSDAYGTYSLSGSGSLSITGGEVIGQQGDGTLIQSGGTNVTDTLIVGQYGGEAFYSLSGAGLLSVSGSEYLGDQLMFGGTATFNQSGGSNKTGGSLIVGEGSSGTYSQSGGTNTVDGTLTLGSSANITGTYSLTGGVLSASTENIGSAGSGTVTQTGGTVTIASPSSPSSLAINTNSQYSLSTTTGPASLQVYGNLTCQSTSGGDGFTQTGGSSNITGNVELQSDGAAVNSSTYAYFPAYLSFGGTADFSVGGTLSLGTYCTYTQSGGSVTVAGTFSISAATLLQGAASATFSSGSLTVGTLNTSGVPANFAWTGGTLELTGQPLDFDSPTTDSDAGLGNSLTLGSSQGLTVEAYEWLNGSGASVSQSSGSTNICTDLYLGNTDVSTSYQLNTDATLTTTYSASGYQYIGYEGGDGSTDTFQQFGGTNNSNDLFIGYSDNAIGTYTQTGGTNGVTGNLYLAYSGQTQGTYTLGGGSLTVENGYIGGTNGNEAGGKGTLNISGSGQMTVDGTLLIYGNGNGSAVNISSGSLDVLGSTINEASITQTGGASQLGPVTGIGSIALGQSSGKPTSMTVQSIVQSSVAISSTGTLTILTNTATTTNTLDSLSVTGSGTLNITNNHLFIDYGSGADPIASIAAWIKSGYNGGSWNGPGIISSTAASNHAYGVGWADGKDGVVSGLSTGQIEIKYTLLGDANLDGTVNGSDFSILAANFGTGHTNWDQGNFLYGSSVNGSDFSALAANFGQGDSGAAVAVSAADVAALDAFAVANGLPLPTLSAVPEPGTVGLIALAGGATLARRRR